MIIQQYIPTRLQWLVHKIWEQKAEHPAQLQILPSGYVELLFNIGPAMEDLQGKNVGSVFNPTRNFCFLSGLHTKPLLMSFSRFHVIGVQMHPLAVKTIFGIPCHEVRDWAIPGELLLADLAEIEDKLRGAGDFMTKARWIEHYLLRKIEETTELQTALKITEALHQAKLKTQLGGWVKMESLTGYSRMHTSRLFKDWFGLAPAQTLRLHLFIDTLALFHSKADRLTDIGLQSGFYDQAHFIRTFHEFAGMTPGEYKNRMTPALIGQLLR